MLLNLLLVLSNLEIYISLWMNPSSKTAIITESAQLMAVWLFAKNWSTFKGCAHNFVLYNKLMHKALQEKFSFAAVNKKDSASHHLQPWQQSDEETCVTALW